MAPDADRTEYKDLSGSIKTGCMNSPEPNSRYCKVRLRTCTTCPDTETDEAAPPLTNTHNGIVESILEKKKSQLLQGMVRSTIVVILYTTNIFQMIIFLIWSVSLHKGMDTRPGCARLL